MFENLNMGNKWPGVRNRKVNRAGQPGMKLKKLKIKQ